MCSEDFETYNNDYKISFVNNKGEGMYRTITVEWTYFFNEQILSLTFLNPPECQKE